MNIGIFYIGIGEKYFSLYKLFKETFDMYFLPNHNKHYFIISDNEYNYKLHDNETRIIVENEGWPKSTLKRFEYFKMFNTLNMDYLFYFNGNAMCQHEVNDEDILPNENDNWLCGCYLFFHHKQSPYDENPKSSCYMKVKNKNMSFRGGLLGGRRKEFIEMCDECIKMIKIDEKINYIPLWHDEAYFNKYVENKNIKKINDKIFSYVNYHIKKTNIKPKIFLRDKRIVFGEKFLIELKGNDYINKKLNN